MTLRNLIIISLGVSLSLAATPPAKVDGFQQFLPPKVLAGTSKTAGLMEDFSEAALIKPNLICLHLQYLLALEQTPAKPDSFMERLRQFRGLNSIQLRAKRLLILTQLKEQER